MVKITFRNGALETSKSHFPFDDEKHGQAVSTSDQSQARCAILLIA